jgi:hypothetical protein
MAKKGDGRRRDDPTPEEIQGECERIRKGWSSGDRILRRARWRRQPWRLPEIPMGEGDVDSHEADIDNPSEEDGS